MKRFPSWRDKTRYPDPVTILPVQWVEMDSWLPDWRDETQYPDPATTSSVQWAWEYLRRNPAYQQRWKLEIKPYFDPMFVDWSFESATKKAPRHVIRSPWAGDDRQREFKQQFHISTYPPPPWEPKAKLVFVTQLISSYQTVRKNRYRLELQQNPYPLEHDECLVLFKTSWPLRPQLKNAEKLVRGLIRERKPAIPRFRGKKQNQQQLYRVYLRLLDAKAAGASPSKMEKVIYPNYQSHKAKHDARYGLKRGAILRDRDYWLIAARSGTSK